MSCINGKLIQYARKQQRMRQEELADLLGLTRTQVSNIERGTVETSIPTLARITTIFGLSMDVLIDWQSLGLKPPKRAHMTGAPLPFDELGSPEIEHLPFD